MSTQRATLFVGAAAAAALLLVWLGVVDVARAARFAGAAIAAVSFAVLIGRFAPTRDEERRFAAAVVGEVTEDEIPAELAHLERVVRICQTAADVHFRVRPIFREVARARLWEAGRVELDRDLDRARDLLGDELFELVQPHRATPVDRAARASITIDDMSAYLQRLESL